MKAPRPEIKKVQEELLLFKMILSNLKAAEAFILAGVQMAEALVDLYPVTDTVVAKKTRGKTIDFFRSFDKSMNSLSKDFPKDLIKRVERRIKTLESLLNQIQTQNLLSALPKASE